VILRRPLHVSEKCSGRRREPLVLRSSKLLANFDGTGAQRTKAYVDQFTQDHHHRKQHRQNLPMTHADQQKRQLFSTRVDAPANPYA
jgi:hypothetical protein